MFEYSEEYIEALLRGIYQGSVNPINLSLDLYNATVRYLEKGMMQGFTEVASQVTWGGLDQHLIVSLSENVQMFSAAKTFQQTLEMSQALIKNGDIATFKEFQEDARKIFDKYNVNYLRAEYDTAIAQAGNAAKWRDIQQKKTILPYLRRVAVGDGLVCPICSNLNGITLPVEHPLWNKIAGAAHFFCRCIEEQLIKEEGEENLYSDEKAQKAFESAGVPEAFQYNPGKQKEIFSTVGKSKHPYFEVPRKYAKLAEENFNLPLT